MDIFPNILPHKGSNKTIETRVLRAEFGDGYSQRLAAGINSVIDQWEVTWTNLSTTDADTIEAFLSAKKGVEAFLWTPPRESQAKFFTCAQWSRQPSLPGADTVNATFRQEFDLTV